MTDLITGVDPKGPTAGRVRAGEVIDQVEQRAVATVSDLQKMLARVDPIDREHRGLALRWAPSHCDRSIRLMPDRLDGRR